MNPIRNFLPNRPVKCPILFGPLRGARILMNPRNSLRYILGLYEHELNGWLRMAIPKVTGLWDVGANHGFFCFGVIAAWRRLGRGGKVWAFEPQAQEVENLRTAAGWLDLPETELVIERGFVGNAPSDGSIVLDQYIEQNGITPEVMRAMVKIDVEGAELKVLEGATKLMRKDSLFLVEIHSAELLSSVENFFSRHQHPVEVVHQRPLPFLGREQRSKDNWWIVSRL